VLLNKPETPAEDRQRILNTLAFLYTENQQYDEALAYIEQAEKINPDSLGILADKVKIFRALRKNRDAQKTEEQMLLLMKGDLERQTLRDRYFAATYLMQFGKPKESADLLESITETGRNHLLTYQLIETWMRSGQKAKALPVCVDLRERFGYNPEYTIKEIEIYYHYHDYVQAENILTEYVRQFPNDLSALLNLAGLYHRNRNFKALREFCNADMSRFNFRTDQLWGYVELLRSAGQHDRCLELLYEHRREHPSYESNQLFVNYCLADPEERKHTAIPEKAGKNAAVTLDSGSLTFCYVIIDKPTDQLKRNEGEINLQDPIYRILKGKKTGQQVALHEDQDERWTITKILPLYTHVFQDAMHQNTTIYAAQSGYISGEIHEIEDI
jgi:tetratricopeptide (TPR) repeat protein